MSVLTDPAVNETSEPIAGLTLAPAPVTVRLRGSQKSTSCSEETDRAYGAGDGAEVADSSSAFEVSEGARPDWDWM